MSEVVQWILQGIPLAALVVAAGAAAVTYYFREVEAGRSRERERKGLLRLLAVEIEYNEDILEAFKNSGSHPGEHPQGLHTQAWEENRGRIAQLLESGEDFGQLADYFMNVAVFEEYREQYRASGQVGQRPCWSPFPNLSNRGRTL